MGRTANPDKQIAELLFESGNRKDEVEILDVNEVEAMTLSEALEQKKMLAKRREQVMLAVDGRRLQQTVRVMDAMDVALDNMISGCSYDKDGNPMALSAMDFKFYSDAYKNLATTLDRVARLDSVDTGGKSGRISLEIKFGV